MTNKFEASFESLYNYKPPEWFLNAKLGIWSHWGPQSVPMFGDWYARNMYIEGTQQYEYHVRHYGHPSKFGYKDICKLWKAENFDPDALMAKYVKSGARYFMTQGTHHDHFFNYNSSVNRMNSVNVGPHKDILSLWKAAADKYSLPFGISEHLGASFSWWRVNKGHDQYGPYAGIPYDGNDPAWRDFYHANEEHGCQDPLDATHPWYTGNKAYRDYWKKAVFEMIDMFSPELIYTDGSLPFGGHWQDAEPGAVIRDEDYSWGLEAVAHLYNKSIEKHGSNHAVYLQKDRRPEIYKVGVLDVEKSQLADLSPDAWHTDTCIGGWFYDVRSPYKKPEQIIEMLTDIISKNGCMLLNILQRPDGSIDDDAEFILQRMADWYAVCGEAVYGTRPWRVFGEGETRVLIDGFREEATDWKTNDFRFTQKDGAVYVFMMGAKPGQTVRIRSFSGNDVKEANLLGAGQIPYSFDSDGLKLVLPGKLPVNCCNTLKVRIA